MALLLGSWEYFIYRAGCGLEDRQRGNLLVSQRATMAKDPRPSIMLPARLQEHVEGS